ncbi:chromosome segregation in meiosis- protein [Tieghemiomyces parasiticus]|uniref:Chromosome segregation in meiosis protein n=1 Tax=Tieghemiomyces parasiticus TaxID=78921 RepID=A0A9W8A4E7_9FUNG|nr:chromosome segregation in meiosis- protein [Tieghemiomyces parasiticus]
MNGLYMFPISSTIRACLPHSKFYPFFSTDSLDPNADSLDQVKKVRKRRLVHKLDADRLLAPDGLPYVKQEGPKLKFYGDGFEASDLARLMQFYQVWAHRLYPKLTFPEFIAETEKQCSQKRMKAHLEEWKRALHPTDDYTGEPSHADSDGYGFGVQDDDAPPFGMNHIDAGRMTAPGPPSPATPSQRASGAVDPELAHRIELNRIRAMERLAENQRKLEAMTLEEENFDVFSDEDMGVP